MKIIKKLYGKVTGMVESHAISHNKAALHKTLKEIELREDSRKDRRANAELRAKSDYNIALKNIAFTFDHEVMHDNVEKAFAQRTLAYIESYGTMPPK